MAFAVRGHLMGHGRGRHEEAGRFLPVHEAAVPALVCT